MTKMKYLIIVLCLTCALSTTSQGQNAGCSVSIFLSPGGVFDPAYYPFSVVTEQPVKMIIGDTKYFLCYLKDCRGAMDFEAYENGKKMIEGRYINSIDTLKHCVIVNDGHNPDQPMVVKVEEYFEPLKDGVWKYYNNQGKLVKEETWSKGILISFKDY